MNAERRPRWSPDVVAPGEADVRAWIIEGWTAPRVGRLSLAGEFADAFGTITAAADGLWQTDDLRPSELDRYDGLLSAATTRVRRAAETMLLDAVIAALNIFAAENPEAPRP
jgi:hypothetical protein